MAIAIRSSTRRRMSSGVAGDPYLTSYDVAFLTAAMRTGQSLGLVLGAGRQLVSLPVFGSDAAYIEVYRCTQAEASR